MCFELSWEGRMLLSVCPLYALPRTGPQLWNVTAHDVWGLRGWGRCFQCSVPGMPWLSMAVLWKQCPFTHFLDKHQWNILFSKTVRWLPEQFPQATKIPPQVISCLVTSGWSSDLENFFFFLKRKRKETFNKLFLLPVIEIFIWLEVGGESAAASLSPTS